MRLHYCGYPVDPPLAQLARVASDDTSYTRCRSTATFECSCGCAHYDEMNHANSKSDHPRYICDKHFKLIGGED